MLSVDQEQKRITEQEGRAPPPNQKAVVKTYVSRDVGDGNIKCFYCATEITSRSLDRWAWHLRGCVKTPDDVKAQIQNS
ncbi:hypothetical protein PC118_g6276 [Phytophthora cactorum]|uniref:Uncharacterized protein n=1 Tax=Phytophthora cactorum TaxID=29920 RepID=A0A8T1G956_9STRA|nr:hypothetical protein PC118_g6276 [Phytophthora cactorum]